MIDAILYVADNIQILGDGKPIAVGLYTDRTVYVVQPLQAPAPANEAQQGALTAIKAMLGEHPQAVQQLGLMVALRGLAAGKYPVKVKVLTPKGEAYLGQTMDIEIDVNKFGVANVLINFAPFLFAEFGEFQVVSTVDGQELRCDFRVLKLE